MLHKIQYIVHFAYREWAALERNGKAFSPAFDGHDLDDATGVFDSVQGLMEHLKSVGLSDDIDDYVVVKHGPSYDLFITEIVTYNGDKATARNLSEHGLGLVHLYEMRTAITVLTAIPVDLSGIKDPFPVHTDYSTKRT
jgi:hypothetical protein